MKKAFRRLTKIYINNIINKSDITQFCSIGKTQTKLTKTKKEKLFMKRKSFALIIFVLVLVFALAGLVGCDKNGDQSTYTLKIEGIVGVSDPVIDNDAKTVAFRVQNSINAFALGSIQFSNDEMLVYEAYSDAALTKKYDGDSVPLVEGENVFWVKGWFSIAPDKYEVYEFSVTRTAAEVTVTAIAVDTTMKNRMRARIITICRFSFIFFLKQSSIRSSVSVELDVRTSEDSVDIEAASTSIITRLSRRGEKSSNIVGIIES